MPPAERLPIRVLVCGGRDYRDREHVRAVLDRLHAECGIGLLIHGGAGNYKLFGTAYPLPESADSPGYWRVIEGADLLADEWARYNRVPFWSYKITRDEWAAQGKKAGPLRNQRMLEERKPDVVIAFPGGRGTADMVRRAEAAGVEVISG